MTPGSDASTRIDERDKVRCKPCRLFPVNGVARALVHGEPGVGDRGERQVLVPSWREGIAIAPHEQRRRFDRTELPGEIVLEEACEGIAPDPRRHLQALVHHALEKRLRNRMGQRARLEFAHEGRVDRIPQARHRGLPEFDEPRVVPVAGERARENQPRRTPRVVDREALRVGRTHRVTHDDGRLDTDGVQEVFHVRPEIAGAVAAGRAIGIAVAPLRQRERMDRVGQVRQHGLE